MRSYSLTILIAVILFLSGKQLAAQTFFGSGEFGIFAGGSQYFGDLNEHYGFKTVKPVGGFFAQKHFNQYISARINLGYTQVGYADNLSNDAYNKVRNLNFDSKIIEFSAQAEFNFTRFSTGDKMHRFTPYLTGGIGAFYYNPYANYNGKKYFLRQLGTEGQNTGMYNDRKYSSISVCFPVGAGIRYWIRPGLNLAFEVANRFTLTDYLDDVSTTYVGEQYFINNDPSNPNPAFYLQDPSIEVNGQKLGRQAKQRGNSSSKDQYMFFILKLSLQLKVYRCPSYLRDTILE